MRIEAFARGDVRANLSYHHLRAARRLALRALAVEVANAGQPFGDFFSELLEEAAGCVMLGVAACEAYLNELLAAGEKLFPGRGDEVARLGSNRSQNLMDKFVSSACLAGGKLDKASPPAERFECLIALRNALVHFRPEWFGESGHQEVLSARLQSHLYRSEWMPSERLFPRAWACYGSTRWVVMTVQGFVQSFSAQSGLPDHLSDKVEDLPPR